MAAIFSHRRASPYHWGDGGRGWPLAQCDAFEVKEEEIAAGCSERLHKHKSVSQSYYILSGEAQVTIDGRVARLASADCVMIAAGSAHMIANQSDMPLRLLVMSAPPVGNDRTDIEIYEQDNG